MIVIPQLVPCQPETSSRHAAGPLSRGAGRFVVEGMVAVRSGEAKLLQGLVSFERREEVRAYMKHDDGVVAWLKDHCVYKVGSSCSS